MELKTSGKMQVGGFRRTISPSTMKLNIAKPMDKTNPEHYMDVKTKRYWRSLPEREKTKIMERAQQQAIQSQGTISMQPSRPAPPGGTARRAYRAGRGGKAKAGPCAGGMPRQAAKSTKAAAASNTAAYIQAVRASPGMPQGASKGAPQDTAKGTPQGARDAFPGSQEGRCGGQTANTINGPGPGMRASHAAPGTGLPPEAGRTGSTSRNHREDTRYAGEDTTRGRARPAGGGTNTGSSGQAARSVSPGAAGTGKTAAASAVAGGGDAVVQAAKKAAQAVKRNVSALTLKEDEQRDYNSESILSEEGRVGTAAMASPKAAGTGLQKAVTAVIAFATVLLHSLMSFLLPLVIVLSLLISVIAGILSFIFGGASTGYAKANVSAECERYRPLVQQYAQQYGMSDYVELIMAVMMQESGGTLPDVMQSAEGAFNTRYPHVPNGIPDPEYSIECGVQELKRALEMAGATGPTDMGHIKLALQGYNYGEGYITWALARGGYTEENAAEFSDMMAAKMGWPVYGDKQYVQHVLQYYELASGGFGDIPAGGMEIPLYDQKDYPDVPFGGGSIATSGCAPTSFAMVASYLLGRQVTPVDAVSWCGNAYYVPGAGTSWSYFPAAASHFGIRIIAETSDPRAVLQALSEGKPVISSQNPGLFTSAGHFIVLRGVTSSGRVLVNDPNDSPGKNYASREFDMLSEIHATSADYWIFDR